MCITVEDADEVIEKIDKYLTVAGKDLKVWQHKHGCLMIGTNFLCRGINMAILFVDEINSLIEKINMVT